MGAKQQHEIQPAQERNWEFPGMTYPMVGFGSVPDQQVMGVTYVSQEKRLYVGVGFPQTDAESWLENTPAIFAYDVNDDALGQ